MFGLQAAQFSGLSNRPQHGRFTAIECFAAASTGLTPGIGQDIVARDDPDARRNLFAFNLGALCPGCGPAREGLIAGRAGKRPLLTRRESRAPAQVCVSSIQTGA